MNEFLVETIKSMVKNNIEKKLRSTVRDFIKRKILRINDTVEMAEHYNNIISKCLGIDTDDVMDTLGNDYRYYCSIIDDEFEKNGGEYYGMEVKKHKREIINDLKKLHSIK